ncbi:hypothetical protein AMS68_006363 [Peltaster fructicola]|uniref:Histone-lysine N-methyltransferase SET9 n=1 Tax=Peltaster fructicola TaxID=286661 RepID=A0A6H0Y1N0_9PEZI|nr:hypothetical protein AMS68_006363 [Peltaster fructicola]
MPADLAEALNKKGGLTLSQLANYDDILTDALVDRVYFWANIRKVGPNARPCRGIRQEDVCNVLQKNVIIDKDPTKATKEMLRQSGFQTYMRSLRTEDEKEHFQRHMRKYINIYLPDCPFEVCTTHRYTITTAEACVVARKTIRAGEAIKYLSGIQVEMNEEEEAALSSRTDFSIVLSSRRKRPSLFLGPARFANHDCDSNARLTTTGPHGITIVACKNIAVGDEITVRYGEDYFGDDNCECLCGTCEHLVRNGWDPRGPILRDDTSEEESDAEDERPRKRQRTSGIFDMHSQARERTSSKSATLKRKHEAAFIKQEPSSTVDAPRKRGRPRKYPISVDKVNQEYGAHARDFLTQWFETRAKQHDLGANIDVAQVKSAIRRQGKYLTSFEKVIPHDQKQLPKLNSALEVLQQYGQQQLDQYQEKLATMKAKIAEALLISPQEAEKYYPPPAHPDHIPLPTPARTRGDHKRVRLSENAAEHHDNATLSKYEQSRTTPTNGRLKSMRRQQTGSPLRNVTLATPLSNRDASDHDSDTLKPTRAKLGPGVTAVLAAENTQASTTDDSSRSSIFSNETSADSPPSSNDELGAFANGNICQNIVEMYTSGMPDDIDSDSHDAAQQQLQEEQSMAELKERSTRQERGRSMSRPRHSIEQRGEPSQSVEDVEASDEEQEERRGEPRKPGDYHLTPALQIDLHDRWIQCRNCDEHFVQHNAYQTRIACPRCERHSKLYGYYWPKTDKAGKDDKEERILDHRAIHRFIEPDEERQERKGRKTLADRIRERELSASQEAESNSRRGTRESSRRRSHRLA